MNHSKNRRSHRLHVAVMPDRLWWQVCIPEAVDSINRGPVAF